MPFRCHLDASPISWFFVDPECQGPLFLANNLQSCFGHFCETPWTKVPISNVTNFKFLSCDRCCEDVTGVSYWSDFLLGYYYLLFYYKGSEDVLGFCFRHFRLLELFQFRSRQPCSSNEGFLFVRLEISSAQLCSVFGKHLFIVQCSEFMFASEHCLNTPSEHFFVYKKGAAPERRPLFGSEWRARSECSGSVQIRTWIPNIEHWTRVSENRTVFRAPKSDHFFQKIKRFLKSFGIAFGYKGSSTLWKTIQMTRNFIPEACRHQQFRSKLCVRLKKILRFSLKMQHFCESTWKKSNMKQMLFE